VNLRFDVNVSVESKLRYAAAVVVVSQLQQQQQQQ